MKTKEQRLLEQVRKQKALIKRLLDISEKESVIAHPAIVHEIVESGLQVSGIAQEKDWYDYQGGEAQGQLLLGKISEGMAAYILGVDIMTLREWMTDDFGDNWRDRQDES